MPVTALLPLAAVAVSTRRTCPANTAGFVARVRTAAAATSASCFQHSTHSELTQFPISAGLEHDNDTTSISVSRRGTRSEQVEVTPSLTQLVIATNTTMK